jgi:hypothetical protein
MAATAPLQIERKDSSESPPFVALPKDIAESGLSLSLLADLTLKSIYFGGRPSLRDLAGQLCLSLTVVDQLISFLREQQMCEIVGASGVGEQSYQFALTSRGMEKAQEALERNQYVGPAPVSFSAYIDVLQRQSVHNIRIDQERFFKGLDGLVLSRRTLAALGPAVISGRSLLLYGPSGNGKTTVTMAVGRMLPDLVLVPYAVEVNGQIIKVYDPRVHQAVSEETVEERRQSVLASSNGGERRRDRRWVICKRPMVMAGGELTMEDLELRYSPLSKFYIAPLQMKANSGLLVIDDFGRQLMQPQELLNRWIVPLEQGVDHLTFHTGDTVELPFELLLIFSTNISPGQLGDEAFFRRIRHKIEVPSPSREEFVQILERVCQGRSLRCDPDAVDYLISTYYEGSGRSLKGCHPRDLVELVEDLCHFYGQEAGFSREWIDLACASYFVEMEQAA